VSSAKAVSVNAVENEASPNLWAKVICSLLVVDERLDISGVQLL
jgi:hypothetical protein